MGAETHRSLLIGGLRQGVERAMGYESMVSRARARPASSSGCLLAYQSIVPGLSPGNRCFSFRVSCSAVLVTVEIYFHGRCEVG